MRPDYYRWNEHRISIAGTREDYTSAIGNYFHAEKTGGQENKPDLHISVYASTDKMLPALKEGSRLRKTTIINLEKDIELKIYSYGEEFWYYYKDVADYWYDQGKNRLIISLNKSPFNFDYYNYLIFFLYPVGLLLENFGYYRIHSSCVDIGGKSVLITGQSGSGKSTSAFSLALNGGNIVSDDLTFIKKSGGGYTTHTITRLVKLHEVTINKFFPELSYHGKPTNSENEIYFDESEINNKSLNGSVLNKIFILEKSSNAESMISPIHPTGVISHLFPSSIQINNGTYTREKFDFLTDMLNEVQCCKVTFGTDMEDFYNKTKAILENDK